MTAPQKDLWDKISNFRLDDPDASFKFSARLARENGWTKKYTNRVIEEYRKFIFLCCASKSSVTPSGRSGMAPAFNLYKIVLDRFLQKHPAKGNTP